MSGDTSRPSGGPEDALRLDGRVALVTGGAGGIGVAVVAMLRRAGATVVSLDLAAAPAAESPDVDAARVDTIACDVSDASQVRAAVETTLDRHGSIDVLVHCAGITRDKVLWKLSEEDWDRVLAVNLDSAFYLLKAAAPSLRKAGNGAVVLISSINGERGKFGQANYAASKAGLIALGRTAARELGRDGVRVNIVAPGLVMTPMTEKLPEAALEAAVKEAVLGRAGLPEDVAGAVLFLSSDLARHVTGQVLRVDGGQLIA